MSSPTAGGKREAREGFGITWANNFCSLTIRKGGIKHQSRPGLLEGCLQICGELEGSSSQGIGLKWLQLLIEMHFRALNLCLRNRENAFSGLPGTGQAWGGGGGNPGELLAREAV